MVIAPYPGLKELIQAMVENEINGHDVQVEIGDLQQGVEIAKLAEKDGIDVIISRGGTAELIQKEVNIPVIDIEVSGYDLLRVLTLIKDYTGKKAVVGFRNITENAATICSLLDIDISIFTVYREEDVIPKLIELQKAGYHFIVGDTVTVRKAEGLGLNGILLTSGKESVLKAFEEAKKIYGLFSVFKEEGMILKSVLDQNDIGIVVLDRNETLIFSNQFIRKQIRELSVLLSVLRRWVNRIIDNKEEIQTITEIEGEFWKIRGIPLVLDKGSLAAIYLYQAGDSKLRNIPGITVKIPQEHVSHNAIHWFSSQNDLMKKTIQKAKVISLQDESVWITGENGTGKEQMAYLIHSASNRSMYPFVVVDCELVDGEYWNVLFKDEQCGGNLLGFNGKGTVYFKKIDKLSLQDQKELLRYLHNLSKDNSHCRFISSSHVDIKRRVEKGLFIHELFYKLSQLTLALPPLRERTEDLEGLTRLFINKYNYEYGKQIAGIRPNALEELKKYHWPGNVDELKQVIKEIVLLSEGPFIESEELEKIMKNKVEINLGHDISLTGTLREIELNIIKKVFIEEDMNYSRTAKRLGINRSTLWRKLKEEE